MKKGSTYEAIVIGASAGGLQALKSILYVLPGDFLYPIVIIQHLGANSDSNWINVLNANSKLHIKEADEKEPIERGTVYIAPPNYHLLIEKDKTFSLTIDAHLNFARPSINVLFETAAEAYRDRLIGIILTGATGDGTKGLKRIKENGGLAVVQDPATAESAFMPSAAIAGVAVDHILSLEGIRNLLVSGITTNLGKHKKKQ